jgi:hypothetical protein
VALLRQTSTSTGTGTVRVLYSHYLTRYRLVDNVQQMYGYLIQAVSFLRARNLQNSYLHTQHAIGRAIQGVAVTAP